MGHKPRKPHEPTVRLIYPDEDDPEAVARIVEILAGLLPLVEMNERLDVIEQRLETRRDRLGYPPSRRASRLRST